MHPNPIVLVGDVGGTHTRLALTQQGRLFPESITRVANAGYTSFIGLAQAYLATQPVHPSCATLAVAGPVINGQARMTNLNWHFNAAELAAALGLAQVELLNDLQAQGYAIASLPPQAVQWIRVGSEPPAGTALVVGLGTGVNVAPVYDLKPQAWVPPAEAGHAHLPVQTDRDVQFMQWLQRHRGFASIEAALSGQGLENLYHFHADTQPLSAADIMTAMAAQDPIAIAVGQHYVQLLAQTLAGWALQVLPDGGLYLAGGVARAMTPWLEPFGFAEHFTNLSRTAPWLDRYGVAVVHDDHAALYGAANFGYTPSPGHRANEWGGDAP